MESQAPRPGRHPWLARMLGPRRGIPGGRRRAAGLVAAGAAGLVAAGAAVTLAAASLRRRRVREFRQGRRRVPAGQQLQH